MARKYDTIKTADGREGTVLEVFKSGEAFLVDFGLEIADLQTIKAAEITEVLST